MTHGEAIGHRRRMWIGAVTLVALAVLVVVLALLPAPAPPAPAPTPCPDSIACRAIRRYDAMRAMPTAQP